MGTPAVRGGAKTRQEVHFHIFRLGGPAGAGSFHTSYFQKGYYPCQVCLFFRPFRERDAALFNSGYPSGLLSWARTRRKPRLLFRFDGLFLLRLAERQFLASLFQLPPRFTRFEPVNGTRNLSFPFFGR